MKPDWNTIRHEPAECSREHCNDPERHYTHCDLYWVGALPFFHREAAEMTLRDVTRTTQH